MKLKTSIIAIAILSAAPGAMAKQKQAKWDRFEGPRLEAGYSKAQTTEDGQTYDLGKGIHIGYGYDLNKIVSFNIGVDKTATEDYRGELELLAIKAGVDLGYAFVWDKFAIKPYVSLGGVYGRSETSFTMVDGWGNTTEETYTYDETAIFGGVGVRAVFRNGVYVDLKSEAAKFNNADIIQQSVNIGYKF